MENPQPRVGPEVVIDQTPGSGSLRSSHGGRIQRNHDPVSLKGS
jgi:hypothetical protein